MVIMIGPKRILTNIHHFFMIKARNRLGIKGVYFNIMELYTTTEIIKIKV